MLNLTLEQRLASHSHAGPSHFSSPRQRAPQLSFQLSGTRRGQLCTARIAQPSASTGKCELWLKHCSVGPRGFVHSAALLTGTRVSLLPC